MVEEPTAALDRENGVREMQLVTQLARDEGSLLITVAHDPRVLSMFQRTFAIDSGVVTESS